MKKRYQFFVSSTFKDLIDERQLVVKALLDMNCIPAGMELFPAADEEQFEFIKKVIDDCDYYVLIVGNRYGSLALDGVSYTEKEFDYAVSKGIKVIALVHGKPEAIAAGKSESTESGQAAIKRFREKVSSARLVRTWIEKSDLIAACMQAAMHAINNYPAKGWVRGDEADDAPRAEELLKVEQENKRLRARLDELSIDAMGKMGAIARGDDRWQFQFDLVEYPSVAADGSKPPVTTTMEGELVWNNVFVVVASELSTQWLYTNDLYNFLKKYLAELMRHSHGLKQFARIDIPDVVSVKIARQFEALGLISTQTMASGRQTYTLLNAGRREWLRMMAIKRK